ncbi:hypothetical protein EJB05_09618 [Eragrostis curvula]|uniref:F-box domain-containing protein n=1 Tax=Eragrostis curvula TaxID=38414 RepID=A0A5J9W5G4_9POAL|nr:hypothetical protein EJB05_09618 [Eragrostis curvula]
MGAPLAPGARDWSELHPDALSVIFTKLGAIEVLMGAGLVCHSWLHTAKLPELWRSVDMSNHKVVEKMADNVLCAMAKVAVNRSCGQLETFMGKRFVTDDLIKYIGDRAPSLKGIRLISCYISSVGVVGVINKFPLLEDLEFSLCSKVYGKYVFEAIGKSCTQLTRFICCEGEGHIFEDSFEEDAFSNDREAMGIATMTKLNSLQFFGSSMNNSGLAAILDNCPNLESLDIRYCFNIKMDDALQAKCAGIRSLRLPHDSISDYEFKDNLPCWLPKLFEDVDPIFLDDDDILLEDIIFFD